MTQINNRPFIAGNWKLHNTIPESIDLVQSIQESSEKLEDALFVVIPPFTALSEVNKIIKTNNLYLGAQNLFWENEGAYTGEISAPMIKDAGCQYVTIGHSERRQYFGETDETVNKKMKSALSHDIIPIMCLGETLKERENKKTMEVVEAQLSKGLDELDKGDIKKIIIAYEPIWAIGTGLTASPDQAEEVHSFIREKITQKYGKETASYVIILYGGSVKPANAYSLLMENNINGALIGGASLKADSFIQIAKEGIKAYKDKK
ncbi:MAG: triose-phosphate isomerase [Candidatus Aminicenantaceae bacterium]